jgi:hypothetical protein
MRELGLTLIWMILGGISDVNNAWECSVSHQYMKVLKLFLNALVALATDEV